MPIPPRSRGSRKQEKEENRKQSGIASHTVVTLGLLGELGHVNVGLPFLLRRHCGPANPPERAAGSDSDEISRWIEL